MMVRETFGAKRIHGMRHRDTDAFKQSEEEKKHWDRNRNGKKRWDYMGMRYKAANARKKQYKDTSG